MQGSHCELDIRRWAAIVMGIIHLGNEIDRVITNLCLCLIYLCIYVCTYVCNEWQCDTFSLSWIIDACPKFDWQILVYTVDGFGASKRFCIFCCFFFNLMQFWCIRYGFFSWYDVWRIYIFHIGWNYSLVYFWVLIGHKMKRPIQFLGIVFWFIIFLENKRY